MNVPANGGAQDDELVIIGKISGIYGVQGWVKIFSHSRPRENVFSYDNWLIKQDSGWQSQQLLQHKQQGKNLLALLENITDRSIAQNFIGSDIAIKKEQLPKLAADEHYWCELIGMEVSGVDGYCFGQVAEIQETGANDVLFVEGEKQRYLIPLVYEEIVQEVDKENKRITVDWNPEYI